MRNLRRTARKQAREDFEQTSDVMAAITREKEIKGWRRSKKVALIESMNPEWKDLSLEWYPAPEGSS